ncbi:dipeptidase [Janthinobacterium agaricidamnosum]|uniref:Membrane dipeptidase family protein n=1 Tax=Janthinobacterium agaricidamnosum NBRC 102515 = DSM 9628 TaxID=1349767 RepID=W0VAW4_9BURK|nr:membrane dipeptidase [Janthinobacterium agaricidamnosum]CDG85016.1 membrane dipeptidase family protein [Janthinobacterium agaricidamnosum NBRC 102515 = DSM 9628]
MITIGATAASVLLIGGFLSAPALVDQNLNRVSPSEAATPSARALALHRSLWIADLHADTLLWQRDLNRESHTGHVDLPRLARGNVALQAFSVVTKTRRNMNIDSNGAGTDNITALVIAQGMPAATWNSLLERALYKAGRLSDFADDSNGGFRMVGSRAQLRDFIAARQKNPQLTAGWLTLEGAHALEGGLDNLGRLYRAGYRMAAPAHFFDTELAGSQHGRQKGGLTPLGRSWLKEMEHLKMIVDLAHASPATIDDVLASATRPLMVSHTGVRGTCPNDRNLSDVQLKKIAAQGGLIGIGFWNTAVCGKDVAAIARAIQYTVALVGAGHVAYGSAFDGAVTTAIDAAGLPKLTQALLDAGLTEQQIRRIAGENVRDFLLANLPDDDA